MVNDKPAFFVDGHVDLPYYMLNCARNTLLSDLSHGAFTIKKAKASGFKLFCTAIYCEDRFNGKDSFSYFQEILKFVQDCFDEVIILKDADQFKQIESGSDKLGTILLLENADALAEKMHYIAQLKSVGIRIVGLTHIGKNSLADGNAVRYSDGITTAGNKVIKLVEKNGLLLDIAHLHSKCFWQLLDLYKGTLITSHTGIKKACDIPRNIDLEQAREILDRGGLIGITFNPEMLTLKREATVEDVFINLDILVQKFGHHGVGLGSDLLGYDHAAIGLEEISDVGNLIALMHEHGYGKEAIYDIMGNNWLKLFKNLFFTSSLFQHRP